MISNITDYALWPNICIRDGAFIKDNGKTDVNATLVVDGYGCTKDSYNNLTQSINLTDFADGNQSNLDWYVESGALLSCLIKTQDPLLANILVRTILSVSMR